MSDPFIGQIIMFGGTFAPRSWAFCDGQLLSISSYPALFSILGTTYGGNGQTTFSLPDLRGRIPLGPRNGPGLSDYRLGQKSGIETVTLSTTQIPSHTHTATANAVEPAGNSNDAEGNYWADDLGVSSGTYHTGPANATMNAGAISVANAGGNQSHENRQPNLGINFIIALQGQFPSRN